MVFSKKYQILALALGLLLIAVPGLVYAQTGDGGGASGAGLCTPTDEWIECMTTANEDFHSCTAEADGDHQDCDRDADLDFAEELANIADECGMNIFCVTRRTRAANRAHNQALNQCARANDIAIQACINQRAEDGAACNAFLSCE
jgi:hypothetical protein